MEFREVMLENLDWINLAQRLVVGSWEPSNEPSGSMKGGQFFD
jgi:hypothetical protein